MPLYDSLEANSRHAYPRPQLRREEWLSLNGTWDFAIDRQGVWRCPAEVAWEHTIVVPFSPETIASGIADTSFYQTCWYRTSIAAPPLSAGQRLILHFGAVDWSATVWVNEVLAIRHEGGYTPFAADITDLLSGDQQQTIIVRADDDPVDLTKPRGKQDWLAEPHAIWYPRTTGIWQTVWLETVPATYIESLRWSSNLERWEIGLEAAIGGASQNNLALRVRLRAGGKHLVADTYSVVGGEVARRIALPDPGIDDYRNELLWSPGCPTLIDAEIELLGETGVPIDAVRSYTALRTVGVQKDRLILNGRPYRLRLVLDQGYWPQTGLTPPDDESLRRDVQLALGMGFNGVRKHQKIEDPRYLYWADVLGLLVMEEMPSAYRFTKRSVERVLREWAQALDRDISHPCIIVWVPLNESWGVPDLPATADQRHYVQALYHLTRTIDPTRPVIGNDGWESLATDIIGIHDYDDAASITKRYQGKYGVSQLFDRARPGGRSLVIEGFEPPQAPVVLTEFGGLTMSHEAWGAWGYGQARDASDFEDQCAGLFSAVHSAELLAGFCYTQFADTYQEKNGLLRADRTPKIPLEAISAMVRGTQTAVERLQEEDRDLRYQRLQHRGGALPGEPQPSQNSGDDAP